MSAHITNPVLYSSQEIDNESYNDTYKIKESALYLFQSNTNSCIPAKADATGNLLTVGSAGGNSKSTVGTPSTASITTASTAVLASNTNRLGATISNEGAATVYLAFSATASVTAYAVQLIQGAYYELPFAYAGAISSITSAGTATLRVTELT